MTKHAKLRFNVAAGSEFFGYRIECELDYVHHIALLQVSLSRCTTKSRFVIAMLPPIKDILGIEDVFRKFKNGYICVSVPV